MSFIFQNKIIELNLMKSNSQFVIILIISVLFPICEKILAQDTSIKDTQNDIIYKLPDLPAGTTISIPRSADTAASSKQTCTDTNLAGEERSAESVRLYYHRDASIIKSLLSNITGADSDCKNWPIINSQDENIILLYGTESTRSKIKRIITIIDLPRERVNLEMWGVLISSKNPKKLANAMVQVNHEINQTQQLLRHTYQKIEDYSREFILENQNTELSIDPEFKKLFEEMLGYRAAFDVNRPSFSMTDILLFQLARTNPRRAYEDAGSGLCRIFEDPEYKEAFRPYVEALRQKGIRPFENYLKVGLHLKPSSIPTDLTANLSCNFVSDDKLSRYNLSAKKAVLDFALQNANFIKNPNSFDPDLLQQAAENLNSKLNPVIDALNHDVAELFIEPTLSKIQYIAKKAGVEYAEVGKTSIAGLNGVESSVTSNTVSAFEETPPLKLNELLENAKTANTNLNNLLPNSIKGVPNTIPITSIVSLAAAIGKDRTQWREMTSGVSMNITPSVLRNSSSAELKIDFKTGPASGTREQGVRPLSRISQQNVRTTVYVNTLDLFTISTFNSQSTIDGGRTYIPIIGTIWKGIFSGIPIFGDLFSWKNAPKDVQHQSIVLTNSFIVPTAMGIAPLFQKGKNHLNYTNACREIEKYINTKNDNSISSTSRFYDPNFSICSATERSY
jgi:hypothetical protein